MRIMYLENYSYREILSKDDEGWSQSIDWVVNLSGH